jgi:iron complex transport system substrate-binding protein
VSLQDVESALCAFVGSRPKLVSLSPMRLSDVWADIQRVADALDNSESGRRLVKSLQQRLSELAMKVAGQRRPTVACIEWLEPLMSAGNWVPELIEIAGGQPLLSQSGQHSPWLSWDDLAQADPDKIVVMPCGFDLPRLKQELSALVNHPMWLTLRAVREGEVFLTDGNQFFNRPGPRLVESAEIIAEILFPLVVPLDHQRRGWERLGQ